MKLRCVNGHDRCYLGPDPACQYCERDVTKASIIKTAADLQRRMLIADLKKMTAERDRWRKKAQRLERELKALHIRYAGAADDIGMGHE